MRVAHEPEYYSRSYNPSVWVRGREREPEEIIPGSTFYLEGYPTRQWEPSVSQRIGQALESSDGEFKGLAASEIALIRKACTGRGFARSCLYSYWGHPQSNISGQEEISRVGDILRNYISEMAQAEGGGMILQSMVDYGAWNHFVLAEDAAAHGYTHLYYYYRQLRGHYEFQRRIVFPLFAMEFGKSNPICSELLSVWYPS